MRSAKFDDQFSECVRIDRRTVKSRARRRPARRAALRRMSRGREREGGRERDEARVMPVSGLERSWAGFGGGSCGNPSVSEYFHIW